jgi:hypothetical protein
MITITIEQRGYDSFYVRSEGHADWPDGEPEMNNRVCTAISVLMATCVGWGSINGQPTPGENGDGLVQGIISRPAVLFLLTGILVCQEDERYASNIDVRSSKALMAHLLGQRTLECLPMPPAQKSSATQS